MQREKEAEMTKPEILKPIVEKKVKLALPDGNAFALLGAFRRAARKDKWIEAEIQAVVAEALNGDYLHLIMTLAAHRA
jgi:hypothetical protein